MSVCCECCVSSGRGLCDGMITRPEESYRLWCLSVIVKPQQWGGLSPLGVSNSTCSALYCLVYFFIKVKFRDCNKNNDSWNGRIGFIGLDYTLITNLMHWLLFIHKILISFTWFEPQVLIFRRVQLYTCSIWYCHSLWEFLVACRYTAWVRTDCRRKVVGMA